MRVAGDAYDVLKGRPLKWMGTFEETFRDFSPWSGNMPSLSTLARFLDYEVPVYLSKYLASAKQQPDRQDDLQSDVSRLISFLRGVEEYYMRQDEVHQEIFNVWKAHANAAKTLEELGGFDYAIGGSSYALGKADFANNFLKYDYGFLTMLDKMGLRFSLPFLYAIVSGKDITELGKKDTPARQQFIEHMTEKYPLLKSYLPTPDGQALWQRLMARGFDNEDVIEQAVALGDANEKKIHDIYKTHPDPEVRKMAGVRMLKEILVKAPLDGGATKEEAQRFIMEALNHPSFQTYEIESALRKLPAGTRANLFLRKEMAGNLNDRDKKVFTRAIIEDDYNMRPDVIERMRQSPEFMKAIKENPDYANKREKVILQGLADEDETIAYLQQNPEAIENLVYKGHLRRERLNHVQEKAMQIAEQKQGNGLLVLQDQIRKGNVSHDTVAQNSDMMNFFLEEGKRMGLPEQDIRAYAEHIHVYQFPEYVMQHALRAAGTNVVGRIKMDDNWSGLFVPYFSNPDGTSTPAIFIKTDAHNRLEYLKGLADNLKMSMDDFTKATLRHEMSHALNYLGAGDVMLDDYPDSEEKPLEYLSHPSELIARAHGDMPYLKDIFMQRINENSESQIVKEAVQSQFVLDMVNNEAILAMGGAISPYELFNAAQRNEGIFQHTPDPIEAITKKLNRQRDRFVELFQEDLKTRRREVTLEILKKINLLKRQIAAEAKAVHDSYHDADERSLQLAALEEEMRELDKMKQKALRGGYDLDIQQAAEFVLKGYYKDYAQRLTDAISSGQFGKPFVHEGEEPTQAPKPEEHDPFADVENPASEEEEDKTRPSYRDITNVTEWLVEHARGDVPGMPRQIDFVLPPRAYDMSIPQGNFPHRNQTAPQPVAAPANQQPFNGWYQQQRS